MKTEFTPQARIVRPWNKHYGVKCGPADKIFRYPRKSTVIMGLDQFGNFAYKPLPRLKLDAHPLPRLHRGAEKLFDIANQRNAFTTAQRRRTSTGGFTLKDTGFRPVKKGVASAYELRKIKQIRKEQELKKQLLRAGINEHQLFLLMYSALHSQTRFEKELPTRPLPPWKRGGISPQERREMEKQRRRNNRLASHGTVYHY